MLRSCRRAVDATLPRGADGFDLAIAGPPIRARAIDSPQRASQGMPPTHICILPHRRRAHGWIGESPMLLQAIRSCVPGAVDLTM
jgi:hypothetical protein